MAKFNLHSLKGKVLLGCLLMGLISTGVIAFSIIQLRDIWKSTNNILVTSHASSVHMINMRESLNQSQLLQQHFLLNGDLEEKARMTSTWQKNIMPSIDSLVVLSTQWKEDQNVEDLKKLKSLALQIIDSQSKLSAVGLNTGVDKTSEEVFEFAETEFSTEADSNSVDSLNITSSGIIDSATPDNESLDELNLLIANFNLSISKISENINLQTEEKKAAIDKKMNRYAFIAPSAVLLNLTTCFLIAFLLRKKVTGSIKKVQEKVNVLKEGNLPERTSIGKDELDVVCKDIDEITDNLQHIKDFAHQVGQGKFDTDINIFNNQGEIGRSLAEMRESLKKVEEEDQIRSWVNNGFTYFADIQRQHSDNIEELSTSVISNIVKYLKINQAGIFVCAESSEGTCLDLTGCYAFDRRKFINKRIFPGEGLVGQCYLEKASILLYEIPQDYIQIGSGLGGARPDCIFIFPLISNDQVYGVIELASFQKLENYQIEFLEKLGESIASSISMVKINHSTRKMLEDAHIMTEQMRAQEEEMRQNMEELQATQEEMNRFSAEMNSKVSAMNGAVAMIEIELDGTISGANDRFLELFRYKKQHLIGSHHNALVREKEQKMPEYSEWWKSITDGNITEGIFCRLSENKKEITLAGVYYTLKDQQGKSVKIVFQCYPLAQAGEYASPTNEHHAIVNNSNEKIQQLRLYQEQLHDDLFEKLKINQKKLRNL